LKNGDRFAEYIKRSDVPGQKSAFDLGCKQQRCLSAPPRQETI
jgi:hypothetical protein